MPPQAEDARWMAAAAALAERARPQARPNPGVGAIIVNKGIVVGRGWTQPRGRPHAEAMALEAAGEAAGGATVYVTLEPCAHQSARGASCTSILSTSGIKRLFYGAEDPDPRTAGEGIMALQHAGIECAFIDCQAVKESLAAHMWQFREKRPHITLKLALSLDGCIATANGESQWITGDTARAHAHRERARADAIVVGGETLRTDNPRLDVRLPGLEHRSPERFVLTHGQAPDGWRALVSPEAVGDLEGIRFMFVEGGAATAAAFLEADLVDRLLIYRAPILVGAGKPGVADIGLADLATAHHRWTLDDIRFFGQDTLEIYRRTR